MTKTSKLKLSGHDPDILLYGKLDEIMERHMAIKVKLDNKDPKKHVVKFSTDNEDAPISSVYISNAAVKKLGDPDEVTITIA